jgi:hypothetical protein
MPTPGIIEYPTALDSALSLIQASNNASAVLTSGISVSDLLIPIDQPGEFTDSGIATLTDSLMAPTKIEIFVYTSKSGNNLVVPPGGRGVQGTTAQAFSMGNFVEQRPTARHHTVLADLLLLLEAKLGIGADTPGGSGEALLSDTLGASVWRAIQNSDLAAVTNILRTDQAALQQIISNLRLSKATPALELNDTAGGNTGVIDVTGGNLRLTTNLLIALATGIATFGQIPVLPGSDPATDNQAVRKAYVDSRVVSFSACFNIADPSTAALSSADFGTLVIPVGGAYVLTRVSVLFMNGSHTPGGSLTFNLFKVGVGNLASPQLNNTNNTINTLYTISFGANTQAAGTQLTPLLVARSGTITERNVVIAVEGTRTVI